MDLYESYLNRAKKYLVEDEEDLELTDVDTEEDTDIDDVADDTDAGEEDGAEEPVELDMANPVCPECGAKRPEAKKVFKCNKCGWTPEDPSNPPKFCPECGDRFDDSDAK